MLTNIYRCQSKLCFVWASFSEALFLEDIAVSEDCIYIALEENVLLTVTLWHPSESYIPTAGITVLCRHQCGDVK